MASIKARADKAVDKIFAKFSDYVKLCDYNSKTRIAASDYDPSNPPSEDATNELTDIGMVVLSYKDEEIDHERIQTRDMKCFAKRSDIVSVLPIQTTDSITVKGLPDFTESQKFEIVGFTPIPAPSNPSAYKIQLRSVSK